MSDRPTGTPMTGSVREILHPSAPDQRTRRASARFCAAAAERIAGARRAPATGFPAAVLPGAAAFLAIAAVAAAAVLAAAIPAAATEFDFSGYTVHYPSVQRLERETARRFGLARDAAALLSRVRLKPELFLSDRARITVEYELSWIYQSSGPLFPIPVDETSRQLVDLTWSPISRERSILVHMLDRWYVRYEMSFGEITAGRQRMAWGTGRIWNPTDLFNPINPASYERIEKEGADAVSLTIYLGPFSDVQLVVQPQETWSETNGGARVRTHAGEYDISALGGRFDRHVVVGGDFAGNLFQAGIRGEMIVSFDPDEPRSGFTRWILGVDHQLTPELYALAEYHFNGEGKDDPAAYELRRLGRGEIINLGRRFIFLQMSYLPHPLWNLSLSMNGSLTDGSGFVGVLVDRSLSGSADIALGAQYSYGDPRDEFRYYPTILYLKGIYHF